MRPPAADDGPERVSTSVDLPFSHEGKRILAFSGEEAQRVRQQIGPEHRMMGPAREENSLAAGVLRERGVTLERLRDDTRGSAWIPQGP